VTIKTRKAKSGEENEKVDATITYVASFTNLRLLQFDLSHLQFEAGAELTDRCV